MFHAAKAQGKDIMPVDGNGLENPYFTIFFVLIVILGNFFVLNLFIGVLISKYNREKELQGKDFMLTESQKKWVKNRMNILQSQPIFRLREPYSDWRAPFFLIAENFWFQQFINLCIVANTVILSLSWYG